MAAIKHHRRLKPRTKAKPLGTYRPPRDQLNVDHLRIRGESKITADVRRLCTEATVEMTLAGASTVTLKVQDPTRKLLNSDLVLQASTLVVDNISYTLAKVSRDGNTLTLIFEETAVHLLRQYNKPRKANRDNTTRAAFIASMVKEVTEAVIPFRCPEVDVKQKVGR